MAPDYDDICRSCGYDDPCGCPDDSNTWSKMACRSCGGEWWRDYGSTSTRCLHRRCGAEGSEVIREPLYAPHPADTAKESPDG
jgi:hypothetical protein